MKYTPIIGLEVHVELATKSKMFCGCSPHHFLEKPNIHTCPVCLGLPGTLPVPNAKAIEDCMLIGLALNCEIQDESKFDRKNYFYPDLPKGYQISQYDQPFCKNGRLETGSKKIRITRVHMEEDTAKLIHQFGDQKNTLIDFNRSGVPLVEIVSEPDMHSADEAIAYLKKIQQIIRYLGVSDADMEKGSMRLEVNISLTSQIRNQKSEIRKNLKLPDYKVEVKNINSFRFVGKAINYEIDRQQAILDSGKNPDQETRGFDARSGKTVSQRSKEASHDYRYFPEPDIPPFSNLKSKIPSLKSKLPELPDIKIARFIKDYGISEYNAGILAAESEKADYFEEAAKLVQKGDMVKHIANIIINKKIDMGKYLPAELVKFITAKTDQPAVAESIVRDCVKQVLSQHPQAVGDYKKGKVNVLQFLLGKVMSELKGKGKPEEIRKVILERIKNA